MREDGYIYMIQLTTRGMIRKSTRMQNNNVVQRDWIRMTNAEKARGLFTAMIEKKITKATTDCCVTKDEVSSPCWIQSSESAREDHFLEHLVSKRYRLQCTKEELHNIIISSR